MKDKIIEGEVINYDPTKENVLTPAKFDFLMERMWYRDSPIDGQEVVPELQAGRMEKVLSIIKESEVSNGNQ